MRRTATLIAALAVAGCGAEAQPREAADPRAHFAAQAETEDQTPAAAPSGRYLTARLQRATVLRARPGGRRLARLATRTEFGSRTVLAVTRREGDWLQVISAELSNRRRGWIPAAGARLHATDYAIHVDRSARRAELRRDGRTLRSVRVAVGRPGNETPLGRFAVTDKLRVKDPTSPYGCCAIALSGHQTKLEPGWPGGDRLAIHGTPQPETIGRPVSLGCMRASAGDLKALMRRVPLGAPVFVRA